MHLSGSKRGIFCGRELAHDLIADFLYHTAIITGSDVAHDIEAGGDKQLGFIIT
jgi:hypothetical protein